jgi:WD repeat-containing protein 1 (actin-interacting protein 1)
VWDASPNGSGNTKGDYQIINGRINDIAWDGDSQRIIAVGDGKQRYGHCVTADSGNTVGEISGHSAQINAVSIRQQRPLRAATAGDDKNLVFYHGAPFKFNDIPGRGSHSNFIYGVAFSPDGNTLVSVGGDKKIFLYDGKTGAVKSQLTTSDDHTGSIFGVSWSKDSKSFVTCSADRTVKIWDPEAGKVKHTWSLGDVSDIDSQQVGVVWPARSDDLIISLSLSGTLNYLSPTSQAPTQRVSGHQKSITALTASTSSPPTLWTGDASGRVTSWSTSGTPTPVSGSSHTNIISGLAASQTKPDHPQVYSTAWDDTLRTIDANSHTYVGESISLTSQPTALTCTPNSTVVAQANSVHVYTNGELDGELDLPCNPTALAAHESTLAIGLADSSLRLYNIQPNKAPKLITQIDKVSATALSALSFSPKADKLAVGTQSGKIYVYSLSSSLTSTITSAVTGSGGASLELLTDRWSAHTAKVTGIAWNAEGTGAVSVGLDTSLFVWSLEKQGRRVECRGAHKEGGSGVVWVGEEVFSAGADGAVKRWKVTV